MNKLFLIFILIFIAVSCFQSSKIQIQPWTENPWYWQYKGKPVMLLGASDDDNLFQWTADRLIPHLDSMQAVGANYVRNTMSDRQMGGFELYPFKALENGKYDLNNWNEEYWNRFEIFLNETSKRNIIIQIEVWDRFDYSQAHWPPHPYNPKNNINYTFQEAGLDSVYPAHPIDNKQPFFFTTPLQRNNKLLLDIQQKFVDKMLSYSLKHNHILYCIDNETAAEEEWAIYWADFIREKATQAGKKVNITEMWGNTDITSEVHKRTFDHPKRFDYCDVSQNNHKQGQLHWENFQWVKNYLSHLPRPVNTVKTYGADTWTYGDTKEGIERWWRHVLGGAASARFHRPDAGLGLSALSMASVKAAREIESIEPFWKMFPANNLLTEREENEAYVTANTGQVYVVFFTNGGEVALDLNTHNKNFNLKWMEVRTGEWKKGNILIEGGEKIRLKTPGKNEWVAVIYQK